MTSLKLLYLKGALSYLHMDQSSRNFVPYFNFYQFSHHGKKQSTVMLFKSQVYHSMKN